MMTAVLINGTSLDLAPARVMRARTILVQRHLSSHEWLLRRKSDGKFLACAAIRGRVGWTWLVRADTKWRYEAHALAKQAQHLRALHYAGPRANLAAQARFVGEALDSTLVAATGSQYAQRSGLAPVREPTLLAYAGVDRYRRPLWLEAPASLAWTRMRDAAARDDVAIEAISGFRSHAYQAGIFLRKLARGQSIDEILAVNAAPGFSEHHSGRALDIGTPGEAPAEETFEETSAFDWLTNNARRFGFAMSYPRGNPHGIDYEPWHWMWHPAQVGNGKPPGL